MHKKIQQGKLKHFSFWVMLIEEMLCLIFWTQKFAKIQKHIVESLSREIWPFTCKKIQQLDLYWNVYILPWLHDDFGLVNCFLIDGLNTSVSLFCFKICTFKENNQKLEIIKTSLYIFRNAQTNTSCYTKKFWKQNWSLLQIAVSSAGWWDCSILHWL